MTGDSEQDVFARNGTTRDAVQRLVDGFFSEGGLAVADLPDGDFRSLLYGLSRVFSSRIMNCVDASGRYDREWGRLSGLLKEACRRLGYAVEDDLWDALSKSLAKALNEVGGEAGSKAGSEAGSKAGSVTGGGEDGS